MVTKLVKILILSGILTILSNLTLLADGLEGNPTMVANADNTYIVYYKQIAVQIITAAFFIQVAAVIYVVARNNKNSKKMIIQLVVATAITGILWQIIE